MLLKAIVTSLNSVPSWGSVTRASNCPPATCVAAEDKSRVERPIRRVRKKHTAREATPAAISARDNDAPDAVRKASSA